MKNQNKNFKITPFPKIRHIFVELLNRGRQRNTIHALIETDVSLIRAYLRRKKEETGASYSLTAYIAFCLGKALNEHKYMQAYRKGRSNLVLFDDVDIDIAVERKIKKSNAPLLPLTLRAANKKSFTDIHHEIRKAQQEKVEQTNQSLKLYLTLPRMIEQLIMRIFWRRYFANPFLRRKSGGMVMITAVGMFGKGIGWGLPVANHTLGLTLGGIDKKPAVIDDEIVVREFMAMTFSFDHDVVDGAPAARFIKYFRELIETGFGLDG